MTPNGVNSPRQVMEGVVGATKISDDLSRYAVDGLSPTTVVNPSSIDDLQKIVGAAWEENLSLVPWGGGTRSTVGNKIERLDIAVDLTHIDKLIDHNPADLTATVSASVTLDSLRQETANF